MPWFRNASGREFEMHGRWAEAISGRPDIMPISGPGGSEEPRTLAVSDGDTLRLRKADLQAQAAALGLSTEGSKAELVARIQSAAGGAPPSPAPAELSPDRWEPL